MNFVLFLLGLIATASATTIFRFSVTPINSNKWVSFMIALIVVHSVAIATLIGGIVVMFRAMFPGVL